MIVNSVFNRILKQGTVIAPTKVHYLNRFKFELINKVRFKTRSSNITFLYICDGIIIALGNVEIIGTILKIKFFFELIKLLIMTNLFWFYVLILSTAHGAA